ncbi:glycosyltransferase [Akkermansiaceae bacterium]|nr:glycosyltransferase [Akkermansiaceae bacterium]
MPRLKVDGKHFLLDGKRHFLRCVTYGPFPSEAGIDDAAELARIAEAGFDAIRTYRLPSQDLLDEAQLAGLVVIPTHAWAHGCDFRAEPEIYHSAKKDLLRWLEAYLGHPALGALLVGNEIPSDIARWMGPARVREKIDELILAAKQIAPDLPVAYASFPTTEYLEPLHADFTAFNVFLEDALALKSYLARLHHIAGDRPVFLAEFGLDTQRNSEEKQQELLSSALRISKEEGLSGCALYAWSDHWWNNDRSMDEWSFGLTRRDGSAKPVLKNLPETEYSLAENFPRISVIICTRNGADRLPLCLKSAKALKYPDFEIIIVNDGSTDRTRSLLDQESDIRTLHLDPGGLSLARNLGAAQATGEIFAFTDDDCEVDPHWLAELARVFTTSDYAAVGGPNLSPPSGTLSLALTTAAPGAPTHVMLTDREAEHLPGCNIAVRREVFEKVGGFDVIFHTAGDDVDFCWRVRDEKLTLGFSPAAFVWHHRRATPWRYLRQQMGYGQAEALLFKKHPHRFREGGIRWAGAVYQGSALGVQTGDFLYTGPSGDAPYQSLALNRQPVRGLTVAYDRFLPRLLLKILGWLSAYLRCWTRTRHGGPGRPERTPLFLQKSAPANRVLTLTHPDGLGRHELYAALQADAWLACPENDWDLQRDHPRLFAATEQIPSTSRRTFIRLHASEAAFAQLKERCLHAGFLIGKGDADHLYISKVT